MAIAAGLFGPRMVKRSRLRKRLELFATGAVAGAGAEKDGKTNRKTVQDALRIIEQENKGSSKRVSTRQKLQQAHLDIKPMLFHVICAIVGIIVGGLMWLLGYTPFMSFAIGFASGFGLPRLVISIIAKRRVKAFTAHFVNAVEIIMRGVKSGLPLGDCLRVIARETPEPLCTEFQIMIDEQRMGLTLTDALQRMVERVPSSDLMFFSIALAIQQQTGGNLTEALENLSIVLRDRNLMKAKIKAMSSEAKSSAGIIGSLPFIVGGIVYLIKPEYISLLFTTDTGNMMLYGGLGWMTIGVLVMWKMINFDF